MDINSRLGDLVGDKGLFVVEILRFWKIRKDDKDIYISIPISSTSQTFFPPLPPHHLMLLYPSPPSLLPACQHKYSAGHSCDTTLLQFCHHCIAHGIPYFSVTYRWKLWHGGSSLFIWTVGGIIFLQRPLQFWRRRLEMDAIACGKAMVNSVDHSDEAD